MIWSVLDLQQYFLGGVSGHTRLMCPQIQEHSKAKTEVLSGEFADFTTGYIYCICICIHIRCGYKHTHIYTHMHNINTFEGGARGTGYQHYIRKG